MYEKVTQITEMRPQRESSAFQETWPLPTITLIDPDTQQSCLHKELIQRNGNNTRKYSSTI